MLLHIYYLIGILVVLTLSYQIFNFKKFEKLNQWLISFKKVTGENALKSDFRHIDDYNMILTRNIYAIFEMMWVLLGIITNNWFVFIWLIIYSKFFGMAVKNIRYTYLGKAMFFKLLLGKFIIYSFLILNHFHFNIDIWQELLNIFN